MFFSPSCSKVRAEPKVLDSRLGKHAFLRGQSPGQSGKYQDCTMAEDHELSGDPRHDRRSDRQTTGCFAGLASLSQRSHESFLPDERLSSPCPQARESRSPRIGLLWPAEEGHLSPPLLSWQLCLFPQGWVYPAGAAARCLGDPYCVPYRNGEWGAWLYRLVVPPAGGLMIPHCQDSQRSYRQKDQMTKTPADPAYHHLSLSMYLQVLYRCCARHLRRITGQ